MLHLLRLKYSTSERAAEPHIQDHVAFLDRHRADGTFLSGQTLPTADGGLILAVGIDRERAETIAGEDPFVRACVARYDITTVTHGRAHPALAALTGGRPVAPQ